LTSCLITRHFVVNFANRVGSPTREEIEGFLKEVINNGYARKTDEGLITLFYRTYRVLIRHNTRNPKISDYVAVTVQSSMKEYTKPYNQKKKNRIEMKMFDTIIYHKGVKDETKNTKTIKRG